LEENAFVAAEIRKSGFPLEVEITELLEKGGWDVLPSYFYFDRDEMVFKEIDILAYKHIIPPKGFSNFPYYLTIGVLVECKKRENFAVVFFPRERKSTDLSFGGVGLAGVDSFQVAKISSLPASPSAQRMHPFVRKARLNLMPVPFVPPSVAQQELWGLHQIDLARADDFHSLSVQETSLSLDVARLPKSKGTFKRNDSRNGILLALNGLAKAVEDILEAQAAMLQFLLPAAIDGKIPSLTKFTIYYFFPVLVLEGGMKAWRKGTVTDANETLYLSSLRTIWYQEHQLVDIVSKSHLSDWLTQLEKDATQLAAKFFENRSKLDGQVELLLKYKELAARANASSPQPQKTPDALQSPTSGVPFGKSEHEKGEAGKS